MDDLKAKAIAIGEELLQKGEKILNELKNGKSDSQKNGEQGSDDSKKAQADQSSGDKSANQADQDRMANLKDEALHKFEDTKVKISDLVNEAATKLNELKQMAAETMTKMKGDDQSQSDDSKKQDQDSSSKDVKDKDQKSAQTNNKDDAKKDQDKADQSGQNKTDQDKNHK